MVFKKFYHWLVVALLTLTFISFQTVFFTTPAEAAHALSVEAYVEIDASNKIQLTVTSSWTGFSSSYSAQIYPSAGAADIGASIATMANITSDGTDGDGNPVSRTNRQVFSYDGSGLATGYYVAYAQNCCDATFINSSTSTNFSYAVGFYINKETGSLSIGSPKVEQAVDFNVAKGSAYSASLAATSNGGSGSTISGSGSYVEITSSGMMPGNDFASNQAGSSHCTAAERVAGGLWSLNSSTGAFIIPESVTSNCANGNVIGFKFKVVDLANDASGRIYATRDVAFALKTTTNCSPIVNIDGVADGSTLTLSVDTTTVVTVTATDDTSGSCDAATAVTLTIAGAPTWATVSAQESISGVSSNVRRTITLTPTNSNGIGTSRLISISATDSGSPNLGQRASFTARVPSNPPTGIAGDTQVTLSWAVVSISGETVTYKIQQSTDGGSNFTDVSGASDLTATSHEITGLTNGQAYNFRVIAIGSISGAQTPGDYSEALTPIAITVPNAPTIDSISAFNSELRIFFTAGTNGGSSITDYEYSIDNGSTWISSGSISSPITISGLTNGTSYQVKLRAVNTAGSGNASLAVSATPLVPAFTPQPPAPAPAIIPESTPTPSPTPTPTPTRTPLSTPTIQPTPPVNPLPSPTPTTQSTPQVGSPLSPAPLVQRTIEEIVDALKPVAFDALVNLITRAIEEIRSGVTQSTLVLLLSKDDADKLVSGDNKIILDTPTSVMKDGVAEPARIVVVDITQLQVVAGEGGLLKLEAKAGEESVPVDSQGRLQMLRDNLVEAEGTGFAANSEFAVWLFSDPIMLGIGKTDAAGRFFASFPVEKDIPLGDHTLQVVGVTPTGEQRSISLPVIVLDNKEAAMNNSIDNVIEVSQNPLQGWFDSINYLFLLLILLFLIGIWAIWVSRREYRERKKELELREAELNPFVAPRPKFQAEKAAVFVAAAARRKDDTDEIDVEAVKAEIKKNAPKKPVAKEVKPRKKAVSKK